MVEIDPHVFIDVLVVISMGAFAWCWRLHTSVIKLQTRQEAKSEALSRLCDKVDHMDSKISDIAESMATLNGTLRGYVQSGGGGKAPVS